MNNLNFQADYLPLPLTVEGVTAQWIESALRSRDPHINVKSAAIEGVLFGTATKIRVRVDYAGANGDDGPPQMLIIKGGFEAHSPRVPAIYASEIQYYRELAGRMTLNVPRSWFAQSDPNSYQSIVIMDDLMARGARFCNPLRPHDYARTATFLDAIASTHACWWGRPELDDGNDLDWMQTPFDAPSRMFYDYYMAPERWDVHLASTLGAAVPRCFHDVGWLARAIEGMSALHDSHVKTLTHGDTHLGNLYVEADGRPGFLDAQPRRSPWFHDVVYHLICALDVADRRKWDRSLLTFYLQRLAHYGVQNVPSFDDAFDAFRRYIPYGLLIFLINESHFQSEAINTAYSVRFAMAALDHGVMDIYH